MNYSPKVMNDTLNKNKFVFKKKYGQNFIIDKNIINNIVTKSNIDSETLVIEIGPGSGSLTNHLAKKAKNVLCYEIDESLKGILDTNLASYSNVDIKYGDFLKSNIEEDLKKYKYKKLYVVANLPYYITTPIIVKLIEDNIDVDKIVVMVQKEVGNRFKAVPNSKDYNSLSIFISYYFNVNKIMDVSKNVFIPKPNVDSIVLEFTKKETKYNLISENVFFKLIKDSFKQKRKTIKNNLKEYDLNKVEKVLDKNGLSLESRAEQISIDIFVEIANELGGNYDK